MVAHDRRPGLLILLILFSVAILKVGHAQESATPSLSKEEEEAGFELLFDGESLKGWRGDDKGYAAHDGMLICSKKGKRLYTRKEFANFHLKFEFRLTPGANNGLAVRTPLEGDPAYVGMELQILDDSAPKHRSLKPYQYHGSIYGVLPAKRGHLREVGEWNEQEVICHGSQVVLRLNDTVIVDADLNRIHKQGTPDDREHPGLKRKRGHLGFCGHGARVEFRCIRIKVLDDDPAPNSPDDDGEETQRQTSSTTHGLECPTVRGPVRTLRTRMKAAKTEKGRRKRRSQPAL